MTLDETTRLRLLTTPDGAFPVAELIVDGQHLEMFDRDPRTMRDAFLATAEHAELTAVVLGDERWTYADQWHEVVALAHALRDECGVRKGDRVGLVMRNYPEFIFTFWATQVLGAVLIPFNGWLRTRELADLVAESQPVVLVADQERIALLADVDLSASGVGTVVGVRCDDSVGGVNPVTPYRDLLARAGRHDQPPAEEVLPEDPATIMYTSGTTGKPKGALHSHRNHSASLLNKLIRAVRVVPATATEPFQVLPPAPSVKLMTFPMFHIAGMNTLYTAAYSGHTLVLMYKWDANLAVDLVERERVNELSGPPFVIQTFLEAAGTDRDLSSLRALGMGGSAASLQVVEAMKARFGDQITPRTGYGLTETTSGVLSIPPTDFARHPDSVGRPLPTAHVAILDEDGVEVAQGESGEIAVRGPQVVRGYFNKPDADDFRDGWFHTGDLGRIDEEGLIYIVGRLKDVVIRGGENIYCAEVEGAMTEHPDVVEAAAFGAPHPALGEELVAVVRVRPGSPLDTEALRAFTAERLASFKVPTRIAFIVVDIPRTPSGKIIKRELVPALNLEELRPALDRGLTVSTALVWSIRTTFLRYVAALPDARASVSGGATMTQDDPQLLIYPVDPDLTTSERLAFSGDLRLSGHGGLLFVRLADPHLELDGAGGAVLTVADPAIEDGSGPRLPLVRLALSATATGWSGTDVQLCEEGVALFNHVYAAGSEFDPLEIRTAVTA